MKENSFDEQARGTVGGTISRRRTLKWLKASIWGVGSLGLSGGVAEAHRHHCGSFSLKLKVLVVVSTLLAGLLVVVPQAQAQGAFTPGGSCMTFPPPPRADLPGQSG